MSKPFCARNGVEYSGSDQRVDGRLYYPVAEFQRRDGDPNPRLRSLRLSASNNSLTGGCRRLLSRFTANWHIQLFKLIDKTRRRVFIKQQPYPMPCTR